MKSIDHLNLIPFESGKNYDDIKIAITSNVRRKVPDAIKNIIDKSSMNTSDRLIISEVFVYGCGCGINYVQFVIFF